MSLLVSLQESSFAAFVRDNPVCYWNILFVHALGLSIVVGASTVVAVRVLFGFPFNIPLASLERLFPVMWFGFVINAISGSFLFVAEAADKAVNPYFLVKMVFIALAVANMWLLKRKVFRNPGLSLEGVPQSGKLLSGVLLVLWLGTTVSGRLIAYYM